ncbi:hypothetical protein ACRJ4W_10705 [Streptomyces sp. GLT-R25]
MTTTGKPQTGLPVGDQQEFATLLVQDHEVTDEMDRRHIGFPHPPERSPAGNPLHRLGEMDTLLLVPGTNALHQTHQPHTKKLVTLV